MISETRSAWSAWASWRPDRFTDTMKVSRVCGAFQRARAALIQEHPLAELHDEVGFASASAMNRPARRDRRSGCFATARAPRHRYNDLGRARRRAGKNTRSSPLRAQRCSSLSVVVLGDHSFSRSVVANTNPTGTAELLGAVGRRVGVAHEVVGAFTRFGWSAIPMKPRRKISTPSMTKGRRECFEHR